MSTPNTAALFGVAPVPTRRFTVAEYHRMIETRILAEDDPVELLEGWIVLQMPHNAAHDGTIQKIHKRLGRRLPVGWDLRGQSAITTGDSEAEPDLAAVRGDETTYIHRKPLEVLQKPLDRPGSDACRTTGSTWHPPTC